MHLHEFDKIEVELLPLPVINLQMRYMYRIYRPVQTVLCGPISISPTSISRNASILRHVCDDVGIAYTTDTLINYIADGRFFTYNLELIRETPK